MRGTISAIAPDGRYGQISSEDGQRYSYWTSEVRNGRATVGQVVDFQMWEGQPIDIYLASDPRPPSAPPPRPGPQPQMASPVGAMSQFAGRVQASAGRLPYVADGPAGYSQAVSSSSPSGYWIKLFTSPSGRISRRQFWLHGVLPLVIASIVLGWIPIIGQILTLAFLWGSICIAFKRFHDLGYPGWYSLVYLIPMVAAGVLVGAGFFVTSLIDLMWLLAEICWGVGVLIGLAQLIFVYIRIGQQGPNQYGPDPLAAANF